MAQGKFSQPRPHRDEERQIEKTFRQLTGQEPIPKPEPGLDFEHTETSFQEASPQSEVNSSQEATGEDLLREVLNFPGEDDSQSPKSDARTSHAQESSPWEDSGSPSEEDDPEQPENPVLYWLNTAMDFCTKYKKYVLAGLCAMALILIVSVVGIFLASASDPYDGKILDNVFLGDIPVGGMTEDEAISAVKTITDQTYGAEPMVIDLSGVQVELSAKDTKATLDVKKAVAAAYSYGRTGSAQEKEQAYAASKIQPYLVDLTDYVDVDEEYIRSVLESYAGDSGSTLTQTKYGLEGEQPELSADKFDEKAPGQTLVITMGTPGIGFDPEAVLQQVLEAYGDHKFLVTVETVEELTEPDPINLESIYKEFYIAPVNATIDPTTSEIKPGSYGYEFDLEEAKKLVDEAEFGEEIRIPMEYIEPDILDESSLFQDVLGSGQTKHNTNENRNTNLRLACQAINGVVLNPGETFSFNDTLGQRTAAKGYKPAPAYSGNETVDEIGGGICQVSSTLYYSALLADMEIVSRINHGFVPTYIDYGMDATVSWKSPDFQFRNNSPYPVKIQAEVSDGYVKVQILGTDNRDYYVKMKYKITATQEPGTDYEDYAYENELGYKDGDVIKEGVTGYTVKTYKCKYDNQTNALLSEEYEATSQYKTVNKVVARVEKPPETTVPETTVPETTVPETTVPETTVPVTTAPPETTQPPVETTAPVETTTPPTEETAPQPPAPEDAAPTVADAA